MKLGRKGAISVFALGNKISWVDHKLILPSFFERLIYQVHRCIQSPSMKEFRANKCSQRGFLIPLFCLPAFCQGKCRSLETQLLLNYNVFSNSPGIFPSLFIYNISHIIQLITKQTLKRKMFAIESQRINRRENGRIYNPCKF